MLKVNAKFPIHPNWSRYQTDSLQFLASWGFCFLIISKLDSLVDKNWLRIELIYSLCKNEVLRLLFGQLLFPTFQWLKNCGTHFSHHFLSHTEQPDSGSEIANQNNYISSSDVKPACLVKTVHYAY